MQWRCTHCRSALFPEFLKFVCTHWGPGYRFPDLTDDPCLISTAWALAAHEPWCAVQSRYVHSSHLHTTLGFQLKLQTVRSGYARLQCLELYVKICEVKKDAQKLILTFFFFFIYCGLLIMVMPCLTQIKTKNGIF